MIKRIYYSIWTLIIILILNKVTIEEINGDNTLGIPQELWIKFCITIYCIILAIVLDIFVISCSSLKEISFGFAKITKEEIKEDITIQNTLMNYLTEIIDAEHNLFHDLPEYIYNHKLLQPISLNRAKSSPSEMISLIIDVFKDIINKYYSYLKANNEVFIIDFDPNTIRNELVLQFDLKGLKLQKVLKLIETDKSYLMENSSTYYLFIPYYLFSVHKVVIVIQGLNVLEIEQRIILNLLIMCENYLLDIVNNEEDGINEH